jgi:hypothetical protein
MGDGKAGRPRWVPPLDAGPVARGDRDSSHHTQATGTNPAMDMLCKLLGERRSAWALSGRRAAAVWYNVQRPIPRGALARREGARPAELPNTQMWRFPGGSGGERAGKDAAPAMHS